MTIIIGHEKFYPMETMKVQYSNCHECDKWINNDTKDKTKKKKKTYPTENNTKNFSLNCKKNPNQVFSNQRRRAWHWHQDRFKMGSHYHNVDYSNQSIPRLAIIQKIM